MKPQLSALTLGALLALGASSAHADTIKMIRGEPTLLESGFATLGFGQSTFDFSENFRSALDTGKIVVTNPGWMHITAIRDTDGFYSEVKPTGPMTSLSLDSASGQIHQVNSTTTFELNAPALKSVSSGGSLAISDLSMNLATKVVSGTFTGGNGVGTLKNVALWEADQLQSSIVGCPASGGMCDSLIGDNTLRVQMDLSGLHITAQGFDLMARSLGLLGLGKAALLGMQDYGTLSATAWIDTQASVKISVVPEPGTWATMGLGLVGLFAVTRRRKHAAAGL